MKNGSQKSTKILDVIITVIKILFIAAYVLLTAFLLWQLIRSCVGLVTEPDSQEGFGIILAIVIIIIGSIGNAVLVGVGLLGLIFTLLNKFSAKRKGNIRFFIIATLLPAVTEILMVATASIFSNFT